MLFGIRRSICEFYLAIIRYFDWGFSFWEICLGIRLLRMIFAWDVIFATFFAWSGFAWGCEPGVFPSLAVMFWKWCSIANNTVQNYKFRYHNTAFPSIVFSTVCCVTWIWRTHLQLTSNINVINRVLSIAFLRFFFFVTLSSTCWPSEISGKTRKINHQVYF